MPTPHQAKTPAPRRAKARAAKPNAIDAAAPDQPGFSFRRYPFYLMSRAMLRYSHELNAGLKKIGLDQGRWRVLIILNEEGQTSISEVAALAALKLSTVTRLVQRLERASLVTTRARRSDQRVTEISITKEGRAVLAQSKPVAARIYRRAFEGLSDENVSQLLDCCRQIHQNLD